MTFSIHLVIVKSIFDLVTSYFVWSHYKKYVDMPKQNKVVPLLIKT